MGNRRSDADSLEIGRQAKGRILVCHGDDGITECIGWLDPFISRLRDLLRYTDEVGFDLMSRNPLHWGAIRSEVDFCSAIGIEFDSRFWEGSFISGTYHLGWIRKGGSREAKKHARLLLKELEKDAEEKIRIQLVDRVSKLKCVDSLADEFTERANDNRDELIRRNFKLQMQIKDAQDIISSLRTKVEQADYADTRRIDHDCLRLVLAMATNRGGRHLAGPLVLWDDGMVYAIVSIGNVQIPDGTAPSLVLAALEDANVPVVKISDNTIIGGWLSGPVYHKGSQNINQWSRVWLDGGDGRKRAFSVHPKEFAGTVELIHEYFRDQPGLA